MSVTKEQWAEIERQLSGPYGRVELKADGYDLVLRVEGYTVLRQCVAVYVNGVLKGEWFKGEAPEARKFCCEKRSWVWSAKMREEAKQKLKSRRLDPILREHYTRVAERFSTVWMPAWLNPKSLTRHLRKSCTDISVVKIGY